CCTSGDCPTGFVCFPAGTGGNYCVAAKKAQRSPPQAGGNGPGEACNAHADCRSGLCSGHCQNGALCYDQTDCSSGPCTTGGRCTDTCCRGTDCASGSTCLVWNVATHIGWVCAPIAPSATKDLGETCSATIDCKNDNCVFGTFPNKRCTPSCCSSADC